MNLQPINPPDTKDQRVTCAGCGARVALAGCKADLDGPAFAAYHCATCVGGPPAYPDHCRHPKLCAGKGYCPRDISCVD